MAWNVLPYTNLNGGLPGLYQWVREHFERLQTAMSGSQDALTLSVLHVEPERYVEGTLVLADGTDWDPGSGAGLYIRRGGAWVLLG